MTLFLERGYDNDTWTKTVGPIPSAARRSAGPVLAGPHQPPI